jgi:hypothetical protein
MARQKSPEKVKTICRMLHAKGREVTANQVLEWLNDTADRLERLYPYSQKITAIHVADMVLSGDNGLIAALHLEFGDAL